MSGKQLRKAGMVIFLLGFSSWSVADSGSAFLAGNAKKPGVVTTASGLQYKVIREGRGVSPRAVDIVQVHYHGTLINGTVFDSSVERGQAASFALNQVIKGWTEGLQTMKAGGKTVFYIAPKIAYGGRVTGSIPANSTLIFEVELLKVTRLNIPGTLKEVKAYQPPKIACGRPPVLPESKSLGVETRQSGEIYLGCVRDFIKQGNAELSGIIQLAQAGDEAMRNMVLDQLKIAKQGIESQLAEATVFAQAFRATAVK